MSQFIDSPFPPPQSVRAFSRDRIGTREVPLNLSDHAFNASSSKLNSELMAMAARVFPGGGLGNMAPDIIIKSGRGAHVWDAEGREYIDYLLGSGPMFLGHSHPEVDEAVNRQVAAGSTFFANNEPAIRLAAEIIDAVPCAEKVRFTTSGSEAVLYAMRVARAYTKKDKVLKFEGGYHGMSDYSLMSLAPKRLENFPRPRPDSAGIPRSIQDEVIVAPYNDLETACSLIHEYKADLACVVVEPFQRLLTPKPGFLEGLRKATAEHNIPLIFDEVVTGFRFGYGGAQELYGVVPDLCTLGKIIGGGFAVGAVTGQTEIMAHFDKATVGEDGFLVQIGTLAGSPVACAAGIATLEVLKRPGAYAGVYHNGKSLMAGLATICQSAPFPAQVIGSPLVFDVVYTADNVSDYRSYIKSDAAVQKRINKRMREAGILRPESKFYMSVAHTAKDIERTLDAFEAAVKQDA